MFRATVSAAEQGATTFGLPSPLPTIVPLHDIASVREAEPFSSDEDNLIKKAP